MVISLGYPALAHPGHHDSSSHRCVIGWRFQSDQQPLKEVPKIGAASSPDSVLDFGCGCGQVIRWMNEFCHDLHGSDYNSDLID